MKLTQREEYQTSLPSLDIAKTGGDPFALFRQWYATAEESDRNEANIMIVATVGNDGMPSQRAVLLREIDDCDFIFYSNYGSEKAHQLQTNAKVSLYFYWRAQHRQVRISGVARKVEREKSIAYFSSRPLESQIGSALSKQSEKLAEPAAFAQAVKDELQRMQKTGEKTYPLPKNWGGYRVRAFQFEFWQGRPSRLHERLVYHLDQQSDQDKADALSWTKENLYP